MKTCCIHLLNVGNFFPELTELTLPTIEAFAKRIKADINIITERKYSDMNVLAEKIQVYEHGLDYDQNILIDLDVLIHPLCYNPFDVHIPEDHVAFKDNFDRDWKFTDDKYFENDPRNVGVSGQCVFSTRQTHKFWEPIDDLNLEQINENILQDRKSIDEYTLSRNLAKYHIPYVAPYPMPQYNLMLHLGFYLEDQNKILDSAKLWCKTFWK